MTDFPQSPVTVTLTGEEWFAVMVQLTHGADALTPKGKVTYRDAVEKLARQIGAASNAIAAGGPRRPRLVGAP